MKPIVISAKSLTSDTVCSKDDLSISKEVKTQFQDNTYRQIVEDKRPVVLCCNISSISGECKMKHYRQFTTDCYERRLKRYCIRGLSDKYIVQYVEAGKVCTSDPFDNPHNTKPFDIQVTMPTRGWIYDNLRKGKVWGYEE